MHQGVLLIMYCQKAMQQLIPEDGLDYTTLSNARTAFTQRLGEV